MPLWTPANITTVLWLDASDSSTISIGTGVSQWADKSGNDLHAVQDTGSKQPTVSSAAINSLDTVLFDGVDDFLSVADSTALQFGTGRFAYLCVGRYNVTISSSQETFISKNYTGLELAAYSGGTTGGQPRSLAYTGGSGAPAFSTENFIINEAAIFGAMRDGGQVTVRQNGSPGSLVGNGTNVSNIGTNIHIGCRAGESLFLNGDIGEIIFLPSDYTIEMYQMCEGYLAWRWGLENNLPVNHPYKSFPPGGIEELTAYRGGLTIPIEYLSAYRGGLPMLLVHDFRGGLPMPVSYTDQFRGGLRLPIDYVRPYRGGVTLPVECSTQLRGGLKLPVKLSAGLRGGLPMPVAIIGATYRGGLEMPVEMPAIDTYRGGLKMPVAYEPEVSHSYVDTVSVVLGDGTPINPHYIRTKYHIDDDYIDGEIRLAAITDFIRCPRGTLVTITYNGEVEQVMVEHAYRQRPEIVESRYEVEYVLKLTAPAERKLDSPWAMPMQVELGPGMASEIAIALAAAEGVTLSWQMIDEFIPAGTLYANNETAGQVIRKLAGEWGGCMQTEPDGTVEIVPYYSRAVNRWADGVADLALSDDVDIHGMSESPDPRPGYNSVRVMDQISPQALANLDYEVVSATEQIIYRRKVPYIQDEVVDLQCSRPEQVTIEPLGVVTQQFDDELVTIEAGTGSTRYPIHQLLGKQYADIQLGYITPSEDGALVTEISGQSLVLISYTTRAMAWRVRSAVLSDVLWWTEV